MLLALLGSMAIPVIALPAKVFNKVHVVTFDPELISNLTESLYMFKLSIGA